MQNRNKHRFYIENLGCAKNQVDAEVLHYHLEHEGWDYSESLEDADLLIVNSCGFIQPAKEEAVETLLGFRERFPDKKILMAGCFAQRYAEQLRNELPEADGIFGNHDLRQITRVAQEVLDHRRPIQVPSWHPYPARRSRLFSPPGSAYVKISEGCNHRCSFCAIPIIRGPLKSIPMEHVLGQIRELLDRGIVEINLIAQDLAAYGSDQGHADFPLLLRKIGELQGEFWVRLLYIHPDNFPIEILSIMRDDPRILPYFDIPFQHASTKVLRKMGRVGTFSQYAGLVENIRAELPDSVIRTTFMTGFPGEGNSEYRELLRFQQEVAFDWAGVFTFSREEGTPAYRMRGSMGQRLVKKRAEARKNELEEIQSEISAERMDRFVGRDLRILVEERVEKEELALGRAYLQAPEVDGASVVLSDRFEPGSWENMRVLRRNNFDLEVAALDELV